EITTGPDRNLWFTEASGKLGQLVPAPVNALVLPSQPVPSSVAAGLGATVVWTFLGPNTRSVFGPIGHSVTDAVMALFDSTQRSFVSYFGFRFVAAGAYTYEDDANNATGTVRVPVVATPASGTTATTFTVVWAAAAPPAGYVCDVQIRR